MLIYKHTQVGTLVLVVLGFCIALSGAVMVVSQVPAERAVAGVIVALLLLCVFLFWRLNVVLNSDELSVSFGSGIISKRFAVREILGVQRVRNSWYYGWGIRYTPHGWLFNVSGLDAVELELSNKRKFRIGTDDPEHLLTAIRQAVEVAR